MRHPLAGSETIDGRARWVLWTRGGSVRTGRAGLMPTVPVMQARLHMPMGHP